MMIQVIDELFVCTTNYLIDSLTGRLIHRHISQTCSQDKHSSATSQLASSVYPERVSRVIPAASVHQSQQTVTLSVKRKVK